MPRRTITIPPHLTVEVEARWWKGEIATYPYEWEGWVIEELISCNDLNEFADWVSGRHYIEDLEELLNKQR